ncbi:MAG: hypothetical protein NZM04_02390 [Methylacidiphilales bacterium]|nr:hypothetical protein [Candidatus Methylacidiphilales bacterium]
MEAVVIQIHIASLAWNSCYVADLVELVDKMTIADLAQIALAVARILA